jgi:elongation factor Ts
LNKGVNSTMNFTAKDVAELRAKTNCGMMDCKKALTDANGDMDKAIELLREKGLAAQIKKEGRIASEGMAYSKVSDDGKTGVVIEINAETDFVARNDSFKSFVYACADTIIEQNPKDIDALLACKATGHEETIDAMLKDRILTIGENIKIRRFTRLEGHCVAYVHAEGRIGVLVNFDADDNAVSSGVLQSCGKDVAMQIAALNPLYLEEKSIPADELASEKEIIKAQIMNDPKNSSKPEAIVEKMIVGKLHKYFEENCLVDQAFVKNGDISVQKYIDEEAKSCNGSMKILSYVRYERGEGIEKKKEDLAAEIAGMIK